MSGKKIISVMTMAVLLLISACGTSSDSASDSREVYSPELAEKYAEEGNYEKALEVYTALIDEDPDNTDLYLGRAEVYVRTDKYPEATEDYTQVVNIDNKNAEAHAKRGVLSYVTGDTEEGEKDLQEVAAITEEYSEEEKEELYEEVEEYILIFEFTSVRKEDTEDYYVTVYELEDGGTMILVHDREYLFTVDRFEAGEEVQVRPLNKKSVIWQTEPSIAGNEVYDWGIFFQDIYLPYKVEHKGYPNFNINEQMVGVNEHVTAIRTNNEVIICDYNGNFISKAALPVSDQNEYAFQMGYTWNSQNSTIQYMFLPVGTYAPGIVYNWDFSVQSTNQEYYPATDLEGGMTCAYQNGRFININYVDYESVVSEGYYQEAVDYFNVNDTRTICHIVDSSLTPIGSVVVANNEQIVSKSDYISGSNYIDMSFANGFYSAYQKKDLYAVSKSYAFIDASTGSPITDFIYEDVKWFADGYAPVKKNGMWAFIDESGKEVTDYIFEDASALYKGKAFVRVNGKYGILDLKATIESGIPVTAETISE